MFDSTQHCNAVPTIVSCGGSGRASWKGILIWASKANRKEKERKEGRTRRGRVQRTLRVTQPVVCQPGKVAGPGCARTCTGTNIEVDTGWSLSQIYLPQRTAQNTQSTHSNHSHHTQTLNVTAARIFYFKFFLIRFDLDSNTHTHSFSQDHKPISSPFNKPTNPFPLNPKPLPNLTEHSHQKKAKKPSSPRANILNTPPVPKDKPMSPSLNQFGSISLIHLSQKLPCSIPSIIDVQASPFVFSPYSSSGRPDAANPLLQTNPLGVTEALSISQMLVKSKWRLMLCVRHPPLEKEPTTSTGAVRKEGMSRMKGTYFERSTWKGKS